MKDKFVTEIIDELKTAETFVRLLKHDEIKVCIAIPRTVNNNNNSIIEPLGYNILEDKVSANSELGNRIFTYYLSRVNKLKEDLKEVLDIDNFDSRYLEGR